MSHPKPQTGIVVRSSESDLNVESILFVLRIQYSHNNNVPLSMSTEGPIFFPLLSHNARLLAKSPIAIILHCA
jgi:hypothetical protein